jgi:hypothetical protein
MTKYTAIIIEPRKHLALKFVLNNFLENLSEEWSVLIFHGSKNVEYIQNIIYELHKYKDRILSPINLNVDNLTHITYSDLFLKTSFYSYIPTEIFLVFQTDSMILSENKYLINDFLEYDYVGAPWKCGNVGNGGLSLRKKSKMLEIINKKGVVKENEDLYFCFNLPSPLVYKRPTREKAIMFSIETVFYENPFGIHNCWSYLNETDKNILFEKYPQIKILQSLQGLK